MHSTFPMTKCPICYSRVREDRLGHHKRRVHKILASPLTSCPYCTAEVREDRLNKHIERVHLGAAKNNYVEVNINLTNHDLLRIVSKEMREWENLILSEVNQAFNGVNVFHNISIQVKNIEFRFRLSKEDAVYINYYSKKTWNDLNWKARIVQELERVLPEIVFKEKKY